ncbi:virion morphogenesis family protein [Volucribacter psittacicida]|uniref:Virion morphogenesis family protein n=1 Tax=Volucribacter psittacicida TaxID=203482 RepID=A0A4R1FSZ2_9PAST|nr:phage virion morphogenesis protein [Volucribacter psittacicida]TCJ97963.1 virion morphogenesis family protein [Volucribacter psittacicida]
MKRANYLKMGLSSQSIEEIKKDFELLSLPKKLKKQIIINTLREFKRETVKNTTNQRSPDGKPWKPRKTGNAKMLRKLARLLNSKGEAGILNASGKLFYRNEITGRIAAEHQYGLDHHFKAGKFKGGSKEGKEPCTKRQARKLRDLGYKIFVKKYRSGKVRWRKPTLKEIQNKLTVDQAGVIIRKMTTKGEGKRLKEWIIKTTKRPFLDESGEVSAAIMHAIIEEILNEQL